MFEFVFEFGEAVFGKGQKQLDAVVGGFRVADLVGFNIGKIILLGTLRGGACRTAGEDSEAAKRAKAEDGRVRFMAWLPAPAALFEVRWCAGETAN